MFQQLRLKLTLINVAIMLALFFLLICGTYFFLSININNRTESMSLRIATEVQTGLISDFPPRPRDFAKRLDNPPPPPPPPPEPPSKLPVILPPLKFGFFFVKTSPEGTITFESSNQPLDADSLATLSEYALLLNDNYGTLTLEDTDYSYLKAPLDNPSGWVIVFCDLTFEKTVLRLTLTILLTVGIFCAVLSFGTSFYLANRAMIPIKKAWQQQQDFISDISHELRTPLTVIQTNLDIVNESRDETVASQSKWLDNIQEESLCMRNLVNSLLFLARVDSKRQPLNKQHFCLDSALRQALAPFEAVIQQKNLCLTVQSTPAIEVYGDESQLKQVIVILLDNACRHTSPGGTISVSLLQAGNKAEINVTDSGEGIAPEHLERIFDRFYQVDKSRNKGGSGLGLAIAKWITESHGGSIAVSSMPDIGSTFTVNLPIHSTV
ncbi:sensor histidine kinase [Sporomusa acidovorans]|uniref:histidine kinase n=1 Tax=Sporomusa acidovorans (strain ATCC 49682 / DSM 3132 / Mol) TaxID=1123286 RepID=A0ABZ3IXN8_SPOA4|nr:ATP-binding protein [Sporomusa acidovorans]SDE81148.1 His Kinase A (phospho-acceptor) domain-containing protein [Sporomusa acidovorans]